MRKLNTDDDHERLHELARMLVLSGMMRDALTLVYGRNEDVERVLRRPDVQLAAALSEPALFQAMVRWLDEGEA